MTDSPASPKSKATSYRDAGVDLAAAETAKQRIARTVAGTRTQWVTGAIGACGGMVRIPEGLAEPTLVMSTDGVGTKVLVAIRALRRACSSRALVANPRERAASERLCEHPQEKAPRPRR